MEFKLNKQRKTFLAISLAAALLLGMPAAERGPLGIGAASAQDYYGPGDNVYGPPSDRYPSPPQDGYGPPDGRFGPQENRNPPPAGYGPPDNGYGPQEYSANYRASPDQLENLVGPVALYPDPLLAQILVAATFADQVEDASQWMRRYNDPYAVDGQPWDI